MRIVEFDNAALKQFYEWRDTNKKVFDKIVHLLDECRNTPFEGTGKPEALKHNYAGYWSRRINKEHRLVYKVTPTHIYVASCKYHY